VRQQEGFECRVFLTILMSVCLQRFKTHFSGLIVPISASAISICWVGRRLTLKPIIDEIDKVLAEHYGFTDEELETIINYDIKYRMGNDLQEDNSDD